MDIKNSKVLITGASSGIGKETAKHFIAKGATVVITGRNQDKLDQVAEEIGAIPLLFDMNDVDSIASKTQEAIQLLGGDIDVLVNNAGFGIFPLLGEISIEQMQTLFTTNVFGLTLLTQEVVKSFKAKKSGNIINLGSTAAQKGFARGSIYAASKFAVRGMTQSWQAELRPFNIRVTLINPSEVTTAFATSDGQEKEEAPNKLGAQEIAHTIVSVVEMRNKGFIPEVTVWATNPF